MPAIRRLGPGDEEVLARLAREDADFDLDDDGKPGEPLAPDAARAYLADESVLHWIAESGGVVVGHLHCAVVRKAAGEAREVLFYAIGVRAAHRRKNVGRALVGTLYAWMDDNAVAEVWLLADNPGAALFYRACGFEPEAEQPVYMTLRP